ncbi:MAG: hypothetical protein ACTTJ2_06890 [Anaerovoracaceae bacterium]
MNLGEKLRICENYIKKKGYDDAAIVAAGLNSRMVIFRIPNVTAKYPNEHPNISVAFANGTMNDGELDFDVLQIMCFVSNGVPENRLLDIQKFCSDFNKAMQIGFFGVDFKNASVYFKSAQVIEKNCNREKLESIIDSVLTMIIFYFGYAYEILIELSYGIIGYGSTPSKLKERRRIIEEAMAELKDEDPEFIKSAEGNERNEIIEEIFNQLSRDNPEILEQANIDIDAVSRRRVRRSRNTSDAEETAMKILKLAEAEKSGAGKNVRSENSDEPDSPFNAVNRSTKTENDSVAYKNQMPSVEMFARRDTKRAVHPLDMDELRRALEIEQAERFNKNKVLKERDELADDEARITDKFEIENENDDSRITNQTQASLLQRLRNWTQN